MTPQQQAAASVYGQEQQLQTFLHRLKQRQDNHTVPTALSRRMLQRQGVGYLDDNVASLVSATADRFLATVLQQAMACRDQRLKGAELLKEERKYRRKHVLHHQADTDNRKRRKMEREELKKKSNLEAVAAAEALKATGAAPNTAAAGLSPSKSKKKKKGLENGDAKTQEDDDFEYDSLEEEEAYYNDYYGDVGQEGESDDEDEDENQYTLMLRDLERPLQAWNVHLTGKVGLGVGDSLDAESEDERDVDEQAENGESAEQPNVDGEQDGDNEESPSSSPVKAGSPASKGGATETLKTPAASRKANSPVPPKGAST
jgi:hypothetical protein